MSVTHSCERGGFLVGGLDWAGDEHDAWWNPAPAFGCSRLRCARCGEAVVSVVPEPGSIFRRYSCACRTVEVSSPSPAPNPSPNAPHDESTDWSCAGHEPIAGPTFDGVDVNDLPNAVRTLLSDPTPVHRALTGQTGFRAARLARVVSEHRRPAVIDAIVDAATSESRELRARASNALSMWPFVPSVARFIERVAAEPELFEGVDPDSPRSRMAWWLLHIAVRRIDPAGPRDAHALAVLRHFSLLSPGIGQHLFNLAWADPAWTLDHAAELVQADPKHGLRYLLVAFKNDEAAANRLIDEALALGIAPAELAALAGRDLGNTRSGALLRSRFGAQG